MLAEFLTKILELADKGTRTEIRHVPGDPPHIMHKVGPDGQHEVICLSPPPRTVTLDTIGDLINLANEHFDGRTRDEARMGIWVSPQGAELIFDTDHAIERAKVPFRQSDEQIFIRQRMQDPGIGPAELRTALRYIFCEASVADGLEDAVGKVAFRQTGDTNRESSRTGESIGTTITEEATGQTPMPDEIQHLELRPFANPDLVGRFTMRFFLDPDVPKQRWLMVPVTAIFDDGIDLILESVAGQIRQGLAGKDNGKIPVFRGSFQQRICMASDSPRNR